MCVCVCVCANFKYLKLSHCMYGTFLVVFTSTVSYNFTLYMHNCIRLCILLLQFINVWSPSVWPFKSRNISVSITLILRHSRTGMVWFYTSTSNKRAARPKLYTKSLTRDLKLMYSRLTLVRISINLRHRASSI